MASVKKSVLVMHRPHEMFALVEGIERYPQFLPWCGATRVLERRDTLVIASIEIAYHGVRQTFTTENLHAEPREIIITLKDGPFRALEGAWRFTALGEAACKVEFELHYEFSSRTLEKIVGPVFHHIAHSFIDAFVRRAEDLYGVS
ncbi:MAG: type II toxin-antitoxin system RatA family toxin [Betaproteobacteria bacterium]|jgi:ribosome-associated toxin RatA of RatAB toxin-antitoxin module|nr:type II toxin-antitoxin system RatA family toxin [Betaproteobacteria bacterium]